MKILRTIRKVLAVAVALWALALTVYFLFFAKISFESTTTTGTPGQPPVTTTTTSGQNPWLSQAQPISIAFMIAFSLLLAGTGFAVWRDALGIALTLSLLALVFTFITGFSIGGLYFPGAVVAFLGTLLLAVEKLTRRPDQPIA
jgi:uncharacterized membrane protein YdfJ with MMPL/SSD domain